MKTVKVFGIIKDGSLKPIVGEREKFEAFVRSNEGAVEITYSSAANSTEIDLYFEYVRYKVWEFLEAPTLPMFWAEVYMQSLQDEIQIFIGGKNIRTKRTYKKQNGEYDDVFFLNVIMNLRKNGLNALSYQEWKSKRLKL